MEYPQTLKTHCFDALCARLEEQLRDTVEASREAADYATSEEARAESKWDTQGLEASYLAAGQASQAAKLQEALKAVRDARDTLKAPKDRIELGALFSCRGSWGEDWYYLAPSGGGEEIEVDGLCASITILTPGTPLIRKLSESRAGDTYAQPDGSEGKISAIL